MKLDFCFPRELEEAKKNRTPVVMAGGTVEYHAAHCGYGCDTLIVEGLLNELAKRRDLIIAPSVSYSPASWAVGGDTTGTVHVDERVFEEYVYHIFWSMLSAGLRNIYVVIHHQFEGGTFMPMTLSFMKAGKRATMRYLEKTMGQGWWGSESYADYYENLGGEDDPFSWIKVIPAMSPRAQKATGDDHAGKYETSLLMALYPEAVHLERVGLAKHWFTADSAEASLELGRKMLEVSLEDLDKAIR